MQYSRGYQDLKVAEKRHSVTEVGISDLGQCNTVGVTKTYRVAEKRHSVTEVGISGLGQCNTVGGY